jgi:dihydroorotase
MGMSVLAITGARVICPASGHDAMATLVVRDRVIAGLGQGEPPGDAEVIDGRGLVLAPGLIDAGVFRADAAACHADRKSVL